MEQLVEDYLRGREAVLDRRVKPGIILIPDSKENYCCVCSDVNSLVGASLDDILTKFQAVFGPTEIAKNLSLVVLFAAE
ncbi:hypothetical protein PoB_004594000 [Plakobranchus ocellatus]|uniref:Uncharacterized protein n=1 Tax=Plakobranchus ocellatus TaxID=259542 RepID=A0AAV4BFU5_9GAST|nr:hypothetical protein PoB_004594000 [Plakobranchus ocellatus]